MPTPETLEAEFQRHLPTSYGPYPAARLVLSNAGLGDTQRDRVWTRVDPDFVIGLSEMLGDPLLRATVWAAACEELHHAKH